MRDVFSKPDMNDMARFTNRKGILGKRASVTPAVLRKWATTKLYITYIY